MFGNKAAKGSSESGFNIKTKRKKNSPKNGYTVFLQEQLRNYNHHSGHVHEEIAKLWSGLSLDEKKKYYAKALEWNREQIQTTTEAKLDKEEMEGIDLEIRHSSMIKAFVEECSTLGSLARKKLCIVHFNLLCETFEGKAIPIEVAATEMSILRGIERSFHAFIDPGEVPVGYHKTAMELSEKTHNIPLKDFVLFEKPGKVFKDLLQFLSYSSKNAEDLIVFALKSDMKVVERSFDHLISKIEADASPKLTVLNAAELLMKMCESSASNCKTVGLSSVVDAERILAKEFLAFVDLQSLCDFHGAIDDIRYCSLGRTSRVAYNFLNPCCRLLNIPLHSGSHRPIDKDIDKTDKAPEWRRRMSVYPKDLLELAEIQKNIPQ